MICRIAADMELARSRERWTLVASLGCSKCHERIEHRIVGERAMAGMPSHVLGLVMGANGGIQPVRVHGAVSLSVRRGHGLTAGC